MSEPYGNTDPPASDLQIDHLDDVVGQIWAFGAHIARCLASRLARVAQGANRQRYARRKRRIERELEYDGCDFQGPVERRHLRLSTALEIVDSELAK